MSGHIVFSSTSTTGVRFNSLSVLQSHLKKLYEAIYNDLEERGKRTKYAAGCVFAGVKFELHTNVSPFAAL